MESVFQLQKQILKHKNAKLLAIRKITQDNLGERTAGVDGISRLDSVERLEVLENINIDNQTDKIRRVAILKPNGSI